MEYRKLGRTGLEVGVIGVGTEHLSHSRDVRDEVLRTAVDAGANYVDMLDTGIDFWEEFGPILRPYRDRLVLGCHWGSGPYWELDYCQRTFAYTLESTGNDYVDVALMTMIDDRGRRKREWREASLEHLRRYQEQGRVGYIGATGHYPRVLTEIVKSGMIDVLMFGINLREPHTKDDVSKLVQACLEQDVGLVIMKPYCGGALFYDDGRPSGITPVQCLHYVLSLPVSTTVPGVKSAEELRAALRYCKASDEEKDFRPITAKARQYPPGQCTYCDHCLPCPEGVEVGQVLFLADMARAGISDRLRAGYAALAVKASACVECGECVERCPFDVDVITRMREAAGRFEGEAA